MKQIIERKLPLNTTYMLVDKKYVSLVDGIGCACDNCGKLIANIATISAGGKSYNVGFDCLDTILENNAILSQVDIEDYTTYKAALSKIMKLIKRVKEVKQNCKTVTGIRFERAKYETDYHTFYWLHNHSDTARDNDNVKIKGVKIDTVYKVVADYFKGLSVSLV